VEVVVDIYKLHRFGLVTLVLGRWSCLSGASLCLGVRGCGTFALDFALRQLKVRGVGTIFVGIILAIWSEDRSTKSVCACLCGCVSGAYMGFHDGWTTLN